MFWAAPSPSQPALQVTGPEPPPAKPTNPGSTKGQTSRRQLTSKAGMAPLTRACSPSTDLGMWHLEVQTHSSSLGCRRAPEAQAALSSRTQPGCRLGKAARRTAQGPKAQAPQVRRPGHQQHHQAAVGAQHEHLGRRCGVELLVLAGKWTRCAGWGGTCSPMLMAWLALMEGSHWAQAGSLFVTVPTWCRLNMPRTAESVL